MAISKVQNLECLLTTYFGHNIEIVEENYNALISPGENYGSIMLSIHVVIKNKSNEEELELVAKCLPLNATLRKIFDVEITFKKEVSTYLYTIPTLIEFQRKHNVPKNKILDLFPKCYAARISLDKCKDEVDDDAVIILENLKLYGYIMEDRMLGFDFKHSELIIKNLARFHSVPIAMRLLNPKLFKEKIGPSIVEHQQIQPLPTYQESVYEHCMLIEELKPYMSIIGPFVENSFQDYKVSKILQNSPFATMLHNDYWVNNTLVFRDENGEPINNKMVDFQLCCFGSALHDVLFFLFTSVRNIVLKDYYDELINLYYKELTENLNYFNLDMQQFSWELFVNEINKVGPREMYHILFMLNPIFSDGSKFPSNTEDFDDKHFERKDLLGAAFTNKLKETLLAFIQRNWL